MNRIERRIRNMINPYSTAFTMWWCHSGRYMRLAGMIPRNTVSARPGRTRPPMPRVNRSAFGLRSPATEMAARRAEVDAALASLDDEGIADS